VEFEFDTIVHGVLVFYGFGLELARVDLDGTQTQSVGQEFVLEHTVVLPNCDFLDCHRGDICNHDSPQRVRNCLIYLKYVHL